MKETFPVFWQFLQNLAKMDCTRRTGMGGPPDCEIHSCARKKKVMVCPRCKEYSCQRVQALAEHYPILIQDGKRLRKVGLEKWTEEQKRRAKRDFVYADIRYPFRT